MKLTMPGQVYEEFVRNSQVPEEENWPTPTKIPAGRGTKYVYIVTDEQAALIKDHVQMLADVAATTESTGRFYRASTNAYRWLKVKR